MDKLSGGSEVDFDLSKITVAEYRALFDESTDIAYQDTILAKVTGISDIPGLTLYEHKRLWKLFLKKAREPLADPN